MSTNREFYAVRVTRKLPEIIEQQLASRFGAQLNLSDRPMDREELADAMRRFDVLVPTITDRIDAELLTMRDRRVRLIANFGAGVDHIDCAAARSAGIAVTNTPDALTEATAELAILLMLMAARRAGEGERQLRAGEWTGWRPTHLVGIGLHGRMLGLVGFGRIAQATALKAKGLGMTVQYFSRSAGNPEATVRLGAKQVATLEELTSTSDVLSLHVPGSETTRHMIDHKVLAGMKPTAILVNTARGSVIDEDAFAMALEAGWIGAAALDVYEREPAIHPRLLKSSRSIFLPHLGSATMEARTAMGMQVIANIEAFSAGEEAPDRVA